MYNFWINFFILFFFPFWFCCNYFHIKFQHINSSTYQQFHISRVQHIVGDKKVIFWCCKQFVGEIYNPFSYCLAFKLFLEARHMGPDHSWNFRLGIHLEIPGTRVQGTIQAELKTLEWWISGLMLDPLFLIISRLTQSCARLS